MAITKPNTEKTNILKSPGAGATFLIGAILGALVFIAFFGIKLISPTYTDWIFVNTGDVIQHYLGWVYYRNTPWSFPVCLTDGLSCDGLLSCTYTDSIPLFAIFFKLLSPVLPETFQYIGLWGVICFALNGGFGALLLRRIDTNLYFTSAGSLFYSVFAPSINRIHQHNSLGAIWLIIAAIILTLDHKRDYRHKFTPVALWSLLCAAASLIHMYFLPMLYIVMLGYIIILLFRDKKILRAFCTLASSTFLTLLVMWATGAFEGRSSYSYGGFGVWSANLNTFYNSLGTSRIIDPLPVSDGQYEGLGYLGIGMLLCCILGIIAFIVHFKAKEGSFFKNVFAYIRKHSVELFAFFTIFIISFCWALSTTVVFNGKVIANIHLPFIIENKLGIFRCSGRFIWLPDILIMTAALYLISKLGRKAAAAALTVCVLLNCFDFSAWRSDLHAQYSRKAPEPNISESEWQKAAEGVNEIVFLPLPPDFLADVQLYFDIAAHAAKDNIKLSSFILARADYGSLSSYANEQYEQLSEGRGREDALYIFFDDDDVPENVDNMTVFKLGDYTAARVKK